jgi:hypothetical protein
MTGAINGAGHINPSIPPKCRYVDMPFSQHDECLE